MLGESENYNSKLLIQPTILRNKNFRRNLVTF